jgi:hypothetical protein
MAERRAPVFLARRSYRRRRLIDTARLLPVVGAVLFLVPLLWEAGAPGAAGALAQRAVYIFAVWFALVAAAAALSRALEPEDLDSSERGGGEGGESE